MTECPKCKGYGIVGSAVPDILRGRGAIFSSNECDMCHGSGEVPMTNEEWLKQANTEQLAKVLKEMTDKCATCDTNKYDQRGECPFERCRIGLNEFVEWLNEKHE